METETVTPGAKATTALRSRIKNLSPWRMNVQVTEAVSTGEFCSTRGPDVNLHHQRRFNVRTQFHSLVDKLFADGLSDKRFLDCGCNAGGYCFWAREKKAQFCFGFDIREHWIKQAKFLRSQRDVSPSNRIQFEIMNLYDLPSQNLEPFDWVHFKGLFNHLPEPIGGLRMAADLSKDIVFFSSPFLWEPPDGSLVLDQRERDLEHGGIENMGWLPTGPQVCSDIFIQLGFEQVKILKLKQVKARPERGRLELVAARDKHRLDCLDEIYSIPKTH